MPIRRGSDWGSLGGLPAGAPLAGSDAALRRHVEAARRAGAVPSAIGVTGGDLARTLGASGDERRIRSPDGARLLVDVVRIEADGATYWCVAHAVLRRRWWRGQVVAVMNAAHHGSWNAAPRAHPGDGVADVIDARIPWGDRRGARNRLPSGTHVPHPRISIARRAAGEIQLGRPGDLWLDGECVGRVRAVTFEVEPAALTVVV